MAFADAVLRMQDAHYSTMGVSCTWTPAGGGVVAFTGLRVGADEAAPIHSLVGTVNVSPRQLRIRIRELVTAAPTFEPSAGDAIATPDGSFVINGDPRKHSARRLEWIVDLADA